MIIFIDFDLCYSLLIRLSARNIEFLMILFHTRLLLVYSGGNSERFRSSFKKLGSATKNALKSVEKMADFVAEPLLLRLQRLHN